MFKKLLLPFLLLLTCSALSAQDILLNGSVQSEEGIPLAGATVSIGDRNGTSVGIEGRFSLKTKKQESYNLSIQMLGFEQLDTLIRMENPEKTFLQFTLKQIAFDQPEVIVRADALTAFERQDWTVLDYEIFEGQLLILHIVNRKRKVALYTMEGDLLYEMELTTAFEEIHKSCINSVHLIIGWRPLLMEGCTL